MNVKHYPGSFTFIVGRNAAFAVIVTEGGKVKRFTAAEIGSWFFAPVAVPVPVTPAT